MTAGRWHIFVFCDHASHSLQRVAVTNFVEVPAGPLLAGPSWHEVPASRADPKRAGTGNTLVGDTVPDDGWALDPDIENAAIRERFEMGCRKCERPVVVRAENLYPVLDSWRNAGVSEVALDVLVASLQRRSETISNPEPGQG